MKNNPDIPFFDTGLAILILYSKLSATKCVIFPSSTLTEPRGNDEAVDL